MKLKTIGDLKKFLDDWADFVELDDPEFKEALFDECEMEIIIFEEVNGE